MNQQRLNEMMVESFMFSFYVIAQTTTVALATVHSFCHTFAFGEPKGREG